MMKNRATAEGVSCAFNAYRSKPSRVASSIRTMSGYDFGFSDFDPVGLPRFAMPTSYAGFSRIAKILTSLIILLDNLIRLPIQYGHEQRDKD